MLPRCGDDAPQRRPGQHGASAFGKTPLTRVQVPDGSISVFHGPPTGAIFQYVKRRRAAGGKRGLRADRAPLPSDYSGGHRGTGHAAVAPSRAMLRNRSVRAALTAAAASRSLTEPARALSLECRGRDLVNSSTWSLSRPAKWRQNLYRLSRRHWWLSTGSQVVGPLLFRLVAARLKPG